MRETRQELIIRDEATEELPRQECARCGKNIIYYNQLSHYDGKVCDLCAGDIMRCRWKDFDKLAKTIYDERTKS